MATHEKYDPDLFENNETDLATDVKVSSAADAAQKTASRRQKHRKSSSAFRTISEVARDLDVQQHVLRFWETKFTQVKPLKRGGGRRYYRPEDVNLLQAIHHLLYVEGYTIKGVQKLLREVGKKQIVTNFSGDKLKDLAASHNSLVADKASDVNKPRKSSDEKREALELVLSELKELRGMIKSKN